MRARGLIIVGGEAGQKKSVKNDKPLHHYDFFGMDREKIKEAKSFLETPAFEGAQVAYSCYSVSQVSVIGYCPTSFCLPGRRLWPLHQQ